jgi:hypothetical protein
LHEKVPRFPPPPLMPSEYVDVLGNVKITRSMEAPALTCALTYGPPGMPYGAVK